MRWRSPALATTGSWACPSTAATPPPGSPWTARTARSSPSSSPTTPSREHRDEHHQAPGLAHALDRHGVLDLGAARPCPQGLLPQEAQDQGGAYLCGANRLRNKAAVYRGTRADQVVPYASLGMDVYQR